MMTETCVFCFFLCLVRHNLNISMCDVKLGSPNIDGAREESKRAALFQLMQRRGLNLMLLQETHSTPENETDWRKECSGGAYFSHNSSTSGGVSILFSGDFLPVSCSVHEVVPGRLLKLITEFKKSNICFYQCVCSYSGLRETVFL